MGTRGSETVIKLSEMSKSEQLAAIQKLQSEMGQTGYEAGNPNGTPSSKLYVNTGKSFCINAYLNSDGATIHSSATDWDYYITKGWVKDAIQQIDSGMSPLTQSVETYRFVTAEAASQMFGVNINSGNVNSFMHQLETNPTTASQFKEVLHNVDYTHKAYTSTTYVASHGSYDKYPVKLHIVAKKGTPAIVTSNHNEHEILIGRNQSYKFKSYRVETLPGGKKQLVVDVTI